MHLKKKTRKIKEIEHYDNYYEQPITKIEPLKPKTIAQSNYIKAINSHQIVFSSGPAGTGKTYIAASMAAEALQKDPSSRLILVRPVVEAEEKLGFLPGELEEKYAPYLAPFIDILEERLGKSTVKYLLKNKRIDPQPLAYMRGKTFDNSWVILDEAQNTTPGQMKLFLTRIGKNSKFIIDGDIDQIDVKGKNGLKDAINRLTRVPGIKFIQFSEHDIVRNDIIKDILQAYST